MSEFFEEGTIGPVRHGDRELWLAHQVVVAPSDRLHVFFEKFDHLPRQGLLIACENSRQRLRIGEIESASFVLWCDSAPPHVEIEYLPVRASGAVHFMNTWQLKGYDSVQFRGVNNAAMSVEELGDDEWRFECNDGYGTEEPRFEDLVFRLVLDRGGGQG